MSNIPLGEECYGCHNAYSMCDCPSIIDELEAPCCALCGQWLDHLKGTPYSSDLTCGLCDLEVLAGIR